MSLTTFFLKSCSRPIAVHILRPPSASTRWVSQVLGWLWEVLRVSWAVRGAFFLGARNLFKIVLSPRRRPHFGSLNQCHFSEILHASAWLTFQNIVSLTCKQSYRCSTTQTFHRCRGMSFNRYGIGSQVGAFETTFPPSLSR